MYIKYTYDLYKLELTPNKNRIGPQWAKFGKEHYSFMFSRHVCKWRTWQYTRIKTERSKNSLHKSRLCPVGYCKRKDTRDGKTWKKSEHLLYGRQERIRWWKLKDEAVDRSTRKTRYEKCYGRVARQNNYKDYFVLQLYVF